MPEGADIDAGLNVGPTPPPSAPDAGGASLDSLTKGLANTQREKIAATDKVASGVEGQLGADQARVQKAFKDEGFSPNDLKPWNEEQESAKRRTDPIAAFGSFGSVFGILASAFTHAPMENALNASAAAMTAIKDGDALGYERAKDAWEKNNKLALDRHKIQHEAYQDAVTLMQTNLGAGEAKMRMLASKFGDQKTLMLLDAGLSEDAMKLMESRNKLATSMQENSNAMILENAKMSRLFALGYDKNNPQTPESQEAYKTFVQEQADVKRAERGGFQGDESRAVQELVDQGMSRVDAIKQVRDASKGGAGSHRQPKPEEAEIVRRRDEKVKAGMEPAQAYAEAVQEVKRSGAVPTANRLDDLQGKINRVDMADHLITNIEGLLLKHKMITGLGGTLTRPAEIIGNVLGNNETDRKQFQRFVSTMQEVAPRILLDSNARPLSSEAGKVANIIAGLSPGDTGPNTIRAYLEFRKELKNIREGLRTRKDGAGSAAPVRADDEPKTSKEAPWLRDPVAK